MILKNVLGKFIGFAALTAFLAFGACASSPEGAPVYRLTITGDQFEPKQLEIPAETQVTLIVKNSDPTLRFFYSYSLNRTKPVQPGEEQPIFLRPLAPGTYEIATDVARNPRGVILVK